ncbi:MAG: hypothetical protein HY289_07780 [Planctomycetes bacterium]|nr:hypothetical protein [Planctomycetota bacterium]
MINATDHEPGGFEAIRAAILHSDLVLALLIAESARNSRYVLEELVIAREWNIPIVAVIPKGMKESLPWFVDRNAIEVDVDGGTHRYDTDKIADMLNRFVEAHLKRDRHYLPKRQIRGHSQSILSTIDVAKSASPSLEFQLKGIASVTQAACDIALPLAQKNKEYRQNLGMDHGFLMEAAAGFSTAHKIYAVSYDAVSKFWSSKTQAATAQKYLESQTQRTRRLFVFSDAREAHRLRHVLAAHHRQYGAEDVGDDRGGVFLCSDVNYFSKVVQAFLKGEVYENRRQEIEQRDFRDSDFGILAYTGSGTGPTEYWHLQLTGAQFTRNLLGNTLTGHFKSVTEVFDDFTNNIKPGQFDAHEYGVLRWRNAFGDSKKNALWENALKKLFRREDLPTDDDSVPSGRVLHMVFFHKTKAGKEYRDQLLQTLHDQAEKIRGTTGDSEEKLVEDLYFSISTEKLAGLEVRDRRFGGRIRIDPWFVEQYPVALFITFKSFENLREYYQNENHSEARQAIWSALDSQIRDCYAKANALPRGSKERRFFYECAEAYAGSWMLRVDLQEYQNISMIVRNDPLPHGWDKIGRPGF